MTSSLLFVVVVVVFVGEGKSTVVNTHNPVGEGR